MVSYQPVLHPTAERELNSLDDSERNRLVDVLHEVAATREPTKHEKCKILEGQRGLFRVRVGSSVIVSAVGCQPRPPVSCDTDLRFGGLSIVAYRLRLKHLCREVGFHAERIARVRLPMFVFLFLVCSNHLLVLVVATLLCFPITDWSTHSAASTESLISPSTAQYSSKSASLPFSWPSHTYSATSSVMCVSFIVLA